MFPVEVSKEYRRAFKDGTKILYGVIEVEAVNADEAEKIIEAMMTEKEHPLQTIDERIVWNEDFIEGNGWEYVDWSFQVA